MMEKICKQKHEQSELGFEKIKEENSKLIDSIISKLWYSLEGNDRSSKRYRNAKWSILNMTLFTPNNKILSEKDIIREILKPMSLEGKDRMIKEISEKLWIKVPWNFFPQNNTNTVERSKFLLQFLQNETFDYLSDRDYEMLINEIWALVYTLSDEKISLDREKIKLDCNITNIWWNLILMISWYAIYDNKWKIKQINLNINKWEIEIVN